MNTTSTADEARSKAASSAIPEPWYRQGWPWFLISIPLTSVLLGFLMLYLGLNTNNSLVVDDYYKQGKGINLRIERDRVASLLGLTVSVRNSEEGLLLDLQHARQAVPAPLLARAQGLRKAFEYPERLQLRFVHVTQASKDIELLFESIGNGRYVSQLATLPKEGRWRIHVEPALEATTEGSVADMSASSIVDENSTSGQSSTGNYWRLVGETTSFEVLNETLLLAREPEDVFTRQMLK